MRRYYQDDTWDFNDWMGLTNQAMNVQKFVQGQEDRKLRVADYKEQKARGLQYDQALGALQQGQELPTGIAPSVGLRAQSDFGEFKDSQEQWQENTRFRNEQAAIRQRADDILKGWQAETSKGGQEAGRRYLASLTNESLQQAQANALVHTALKQNRDFVMASFDDAKRKAAQEAEVATQNLTYATNLYKMGDTSAAMDALAQTIDNSSLPYQVRKDKRTGKYDVFHVDTENNEILVKNNIGFNEAVSAIRQTVPQLAMTVAEQRMRASDANVQAIMSGGTVMQDTRTGRTVRIIRQTPKDNFHAPVMMVYDDETGQQVDVATDPKQLAGRFRQVPQGMDLKVIKDNMNLAQGVNYKYARVGTDDFGKPIVDPDVYHILNNASLAFVAQGRDGVTAASEAKTWMDAEGTRLSREMPSKMRGNPEEAKAWVKNKLVERSQKLLRQPSRQGAGTGSTPGMITQGNIDLSTRPVVNNPDGSISTLRSITVGLDGGKAMLIPTIDHGGNAMPPEQAVAYARKTGEHLGIFNDQASADAYAKKLSEEMGKRHGGGIKDSLVAKAKADGKEGQAQPNERQGALGTITGALQRAKTDERQANSIYDNMNSALQKNGLSNNGEAMAYALAQTAKIIGKEALRQVATVGDWLWLDLSKVTSPVANGLKEFQQWARNRYKAPQAQAVPIEEAAREFAATADTNATTQALNLQ